MLVIGKAVGGGRVALGAVIGRADLNVMPGQALGHYTHEKNPVACAAGLAAIGVIESEGLLENARTLGEHALGRLRDMMTRHPIVGEVRGLGLLIGVELVKERATMERASDEAERVMYRALTKGLNFKLTMGNILTLTPALTITRQEMERALDILEQSLSEVEADDGRKPTA